MHGTFHRKAADRQTDQAVNQSTFETSDENSSNLSETETVQTNQKTCKVHVSTEQEKRIREQKETEAGLKKQISDLEKVIQLQAADVQRLEVRQLFVIRNIGSKYYFLSTKKMIKKTQCYMYFKYM